MPEASVNGVRLYYELYASGEPLALIHGSWADSTSWRFVVPGLAERFRVLTYDRRGHSRSDRPDAPGSVDEDADDLAALLDALGLAPAHVATVSFGGNIALRLATRRPDLFRRCTATSHRSSACSEKTPTSEKRWSRTPEASSRSPGASPTVTTKAPHASSWKR